uniref:SpaL n=1 Tax=Spirochaeta aurantia TaxID=147 RepID=Q0PHZ6_SPIAU|nr:SpaL [Spirochaeta aurantia]
MSLVTIITPAFNSERTIEEAIQSVLDQTFVDWQLIVVVDLGTVDSTLAIVDRYAAQDPRISRIHITNGRGLALSRNAGMAAVKSRYVAFLDADDTWLPQKLELQLAALSRTKSAICCTAYCRMSEDGSRLGHALGVPRVIRYSDLLKYDYVGMSTAMVDLDQTGKFEMKEQLMEDYLVWLSLTKAGHRCVGINSVQMHWRVSDTSRSNSKAKQIRMKWQVLRHDESLGLFRALWSMTAYALTGLLRYSRF